MFKRDPVNNDILAARGSEYYNNSIPFEGTYVNFAENIVEVSAAFI